MGLTLLQGFLLIESVLLGAVAVSPQDGWLHLVCRALAGLVAAAAVVAGVRRHRPRGATTYYLFGLGLLMNVTGSLIESVREAFFAHVDSPAVSDLFWLATYPALIGGMALLIRRRGEKRDWTALIDTTIITVGLGLLAWVFLIRPTATQLATGLGARIVLTAYPLGDLVVLALMVRLLVGGGRPSLSFHLVICALLALLGSDLVWAFSAPLAAEPGPMAVRLLTLAYQLAYVLIGAAALHPSVRAVAEPQPREVRLTSGLLLGLGLPSLIAPALLLFETMRGKVVDGQAIALTSGALFLLVMIRMAELLRRFEDRTRALAERDRSARRVLDTINQGLVRVAGDGTMAEERSAMIDRWFGPFAPGARFADHLATVDRHFAEWFRIGHEAWLEGTLPEEVSLAQLPHRLHGAGRELTVTYLPMADGADDRGLLLVINDVSEHVRLQQQEIEQRELLALSHALTRDRRELLALFDEVSGWLAQLERADVPAQRQQLRALKARAHEVGFEVVARLCEDADDEWEEHGAAPGGIEALRARWLILGETIRALAGDGRRDLIELSRRELEMLDEEVARGLPPARLIERLRAWRREASGRPRPQA